MAADICGGERPLELVARPSLGKRQLAFASMGGVLQRCPPLATGCLSARHAVRRLLDVRALPPALPDLNYVLRRCGSMRG